MKSANNKSDSNHSKNRMMGNKRGQFLQLGIFIVAFLVLAILIVAGNMVLGKINTMVQADPNIANETKVVMQDNATNQSSVWDAGAIFVVIIAWLLCVGLAYNSSSSPFLLVAAIVILISLSFVGMLLSNTWNAIYTTNGIATYAANFPMTNFLLQKYLIVVLVIGFTTIIAYVAGKGQ